MYIYYIWRKKNYSFFLIPGLILVFSCTRPPPHWWPGRTPSWWSASGSTPSSRSKSVDASTNSFHCEMSLGVACPKIGHRALTSSFIKYKFLQVKKRSAIIVNKMSVLKLIKLSNGNFKFFFVAYLQHLQSLC